MTPPTEYDKFVRLVGKLAPGSTLLQAAPLKGGVSAQVTALHIAHPDGQTQKLIVRQHGAGDLAHNPNIAADEFRLLQTVRAAGIAAPEPLYVDASGELFETPVIVVEYVNGETVFAPEDVDGFLRQLAEQLSTIHRVDIDAFDLGFLPQQASICADTLLVRPTQPDESLDEGRIRDTLDAVWPFSHPNPTALLHGDYWPGNILWRDGQIAAVIDWEDAALGDPLEDLAYARMEMHWTLGERAMQVFTQHYLALKPLDDRDLPCWDLLVALKPAGRLATWAADAASERHMRDQHHLFVRQAYAALDNRNAP